MTDQTYELTFDEASAIYGILRELDRRGYDDVTAEGSLKGLYERLKVDMDTPVRRWTERQPTL